MEREKQDWIILIVDDQMEVQDVVQRELVKRGFSPENLFCAWNPTGAINQLMDLIENKKKLPDLILLDLWMEDDLLAGVKFVEKIKKNKVFRDLDFTILESIAVYSKILWKKSEYHKRGIREAVLDRLKQCGIDNRRIIPKQGFPIGSDLLEAQIINLLEKSTNRVMPRS